MRSSMYTPAACCIYYVIYLMVVAVFGHEPVRTGCTAMVFALREKDRVFPQTDNVS